MNNDFRFNMLENVASDLLHYCKKIIIDNEDNSNVRRTVVLYQDDRRYMIVRENGETVTIYKI